MRPEKRASESGAPDLGWTDVPTPLGTMRLVKGAAGLLWANFVADGGAWGEANGDRGQAALARFLRRHRLPDPKPAPGRFEAEREALAAYFAGDGAALHRISLHLFGSPFSRAVWQAVRTIPFGEVRSYREVAAALGVPRSVRAVARALHHNPVLLFVPCHRVIGASGRLVGYRGGLDRKAALLAHERAHRGGASPVERQTGR